MFFLKQALTLIVTLTFTLAFSQDNSAERYSASVNSVSDAPISENIEASGDMESDHFEVNDPTISIIMDENENTADIAFLGPSEGTKYKRGNAIQIRWTGGNPEDEFALDLFDGRFHYRHVGELKNSGTYPWIIPKDVEPGKEYKFKLTNTNDFGEYAFSKTFIVKRRVPVLVWIIPGALVVGGATYLLLSGEKEEPDLPAPIEPN
jgi:hypothetical protein